jgi:hypothetical protein
MALGDRHRAGGIERCALRVRQRVGGAARVLELADVVTGIELDVVGALAHRDRHLGVVVVADRPHHDLIPAQRERGDARRAGQRVPQVIVRAAVVADRRAQPAAVDAHRPLDAPLRPALDQHAAQQAQDGGLARAEFAAAVFEKVDDVGVDQQLDPTARARRHRPAEGVPDRRGGGAGEWRLGARGRDRPRGGAARRAMGGQARGDGGDLVRGQRVVGRLELVAGERLAQDLLDVGDRDTVLIGELLDGGHGGAPDE